MHKPPTPLHRLRSLPTLWVAVLLCLASSGGVEAQDAPQIPGLKQATYSRIVGDETGVQMFDADVVGDTGRVLADQLTYDKESELIVASGNVVFSFPGAILTGTRLEYRFDEGVGFIEDAVGYFTQDGVTLRAKKMERLSEKRIRVWDAKFTTCTQPTPYWSFRIARGTFDIGNYAYLRGVGFRAGKVPLFYTPYLVWPIKQGRASGLLFPKFNSSDRLGESISLPVYWAFADNADLTFYLQYYTTVGAALGTELRWLPTWNGRADAEFLFVDDKNRGEARYGLRWDQRQDLPKGFRLTASLEVISDFDYTTDFETDLSRAAIPQTLSTVDVTKHWSWYSLSARVNRHEQFFVGGTTATRFLTQKVLNTQLPEIELRGRSQRLGQSPFYLSFESSMSGFNKRILDPPAGSVVVNDDDELVTTVSNTWYRADLAPELQIPLVRAPWLDLQLNADWRGTFYTKRPDPSDAQQIVDDSVFRSLWSAGLSMSGPRFQRVYETPDWDFSPKLKHVIEPFLSYRWRPTSSTDASEIIIFDAIDSIPSELSDVSYGVRQRLFALREQATGKSRSLASAEKPSFEALDEQQNEGEQRDALAAGVPELEEEIPAEKKRVPAEILSFELSQGLSFNRDLTTQYAVLVDPVTGEVLTDPVTGRPQTTEIGTSKVSPVRARLRFNPTQRQSVDVGYVFDPVNEKLTESSISSSMLFEKGYLQAKWFRREPANPSLSDESSFLRTSWGVSRGNKFRFESSLDFDLETKKLDHQSYAVSYSTQCCSFQVGYDRRDFVDNDRRELSIVVNLSGVGKIVDLRTQK